MRSPLNIGLSHGIFHHRHTLRTFHAFLIFRTFTPFSRLNLYPDLQG